MGSNVSGAGAVPGDSAMHISKHGSEEGRVEPVQRAQHLSAHILHSMQWSQATCHLNSFHNFLFLIHFIKKILTAINLFNFHFYLVFTYKCKYSSFVILFLCSVD